MSKMDELRAMREARYARASSRSARPVTAAVPPASSALPAPAAAEEEPVAPPDVDSRCGHRSMNGRTCTREAGHAAASHRYS